MGKFEGNSDEVLAERLYEYSLDGSGFTLGEVDGFGWYGLVVDDDGSRYILNEDSQGFVTIFAGPMDDDKATEEWEALSEVYETWCEVEG